MNATPHQVHNLIILDESGSMYSIQSIIMSGFNELVQTIQGISREFPEQEHFISFFTFNSLGTKILHFADKADKLQAINNETYKPDASTPLFDAMGLALTKMEDHLKGKTDYNVLVTILTDGEENASREYSGNDIKNLVERLKENKWTFTYMGTDHDVEKIASSLAINNTLAFAKTSEGISAMFAEDRMARRNFSKILSKDSNPSFVEYFSKKK